MNVHESRFPDLHNPNIYQHSNYPSSLPARLREPSVALPVVILLVSIIFSSSLGRTIESTPLRQRLWDTTVSLLPAKLLYVVDDWMSPFPRSMLVPRLSSHGAKSEALARILGRDQHGGILASVSHAGMAGLSKLAPKGRPDSPAGLGNSSNSCYQNSILQGLTSLQPVRDYLANIAADQHGALPGIDVTRALAILIQDLYSPSKNGQTLWAPPMLKNMSTFQQQDAQEYFSKLLNEMHEEIEKDLKATRKKPRFSLGSALSGEIESQGSDDSGYQSHSDLSKAVSELNSYRFPLEGLTAQRVACLACGYSSGLSMSQFQCVTLGLENNREEYGLAGMLDDFTAIEAIEGVQCASCTLLKFRDRIRILLDRLRDNNPDKNDKELRAQYPQPFERLEIIELALEEDDFEESTLAEKCKIQKDQRIESTKSKQMAIARPPPSIAFYINRSKFDEYSGHFYKNPAAVRFPKILDLGPWCLGSAASSSTLEATEQEEKYTSNREEQWQLPPRLSLVAGSRGQPQISGPVYELRAVLTHYGRHENGHYICYRRHPLFEDKADNEQDVRHNQEPANLTSDEDASGTDDDSVTLKRPGLDVPQGYWWRISDQDVTKVDEATVMAQGGVFMLFYDRVNPNSVLLSKDEGETELEDKIDGDTLIGVEEGDVSGMITPKEEGPLVGNEILVHTDGVKAATRGALGSGERTINVAPSDLQAAAREPLPRSIAVAPSETLAASRTSLESSIEVAPHQMKAASRRTLDSSVEVASAETKAASRRDLDTAIEVAPSTVKAASRGPLDSSIQVAPCAVQAAVRSEVQPLAPSIIVAPAEAKAAVRSPLVSSLASGATPAREPTIFEEETEVVANEDRAGEP